MTITWAPMVNPHECENFYLKDIFDLLDYDDNYHFIVGRINTLQEISQCESCIKPNTKNILILKSDERGIIPPFISKLYRVFRMYNNNNLVDYKKIFPIPCGYATVFNYSYNNSTYNKTPNKPLKGREHDIFFSGQISPNRVSMIANINKIKDNYKTLINTTKGFAQGFKLGEYYQKLGNSKIAIVPNGDVVPESFRYFEAFERNCIVITSFPKNNPKFNNWYYKDSPAIFLNDWNELNTSVIDEALSKLDIYEEKNKEYFDVNISPVAVANYIKNNI